MVQIVRKDGIAGLWEHLKDQFTDLKETIMDTIMDIVQTEVIKAGIKTIMSMLTPVGAFIKAAMAIIDIVKFFIQKASQIMELIKAFTDGVKAIASGNVGAVAKAIENALGKAIPVVIGFLASLAGLGGITDKVVAVVRKISKRIENAIVKFWNFVKVKAKGLLGKFMGKSKKDNIHEPEKQKKIDAGFIYLKEEEKKVDDNHNNKITLEQAAIAAKKTKAKYPVFSSLKAESQDDKIIYRYTASPENIHETGTKLESNEKDEEKIETGSKEKVRMQRKIITFDKIKFSSESIKNGSPVYDEKNSAEYLKQLKAQERGINKMMAVDWLKNKFTFDEFGRQKDNNATVRTKIKRDLRDGFREDFKPRLENKDYSKEKIQRMEKKYVDHLMSNTAALHNSDQVSGGKTKIDYEEGSIKNRTDIQNSDIIGGSRANWYIGTQQWPQKEDHEKRATILREHAELHYNNTPEPNKNKLMMSVTLKVV